MKYAGETFYIVVNEGEIVGVFNDEGAASAMVYSINSENVDDEVEEAGYDSEELDDDDIGEFACAVGSWAYYEEVDIPEEFDEDGEGYEGEEYEDEEYEDAETEDSICYLSKNSFTYEEIIRAIDEYYA